MQLLITAFALASAITVATCNSIQVNYFTDSQCSKYTTQISPFTNGNCYTYQWNSQRSASIAGCNTSQNYCYCYFYSDGHCKNYIDFEYTDKDGNQEASDGCASGVVQSVKCNFADTPPQK